VIAACPDLKTTEYWETSSLTLKDHQTEPSPGWEKWIWAH
jgi:hypothetical protein